MFLNAFNPSEEGHKHSRAWLAKMVDDALPIIVPTLVLPDAAGAIGRGCQDVNLARTFVSNLRRLQHLVLVTLDETLAAHAAGIAVDHLLRGNDAVYAAVAQRFGSTLVTLDREQRQRAASAVSTCTPAQALADQ